MTFSYLPANGALELDFPVRVWGYDSGHSKLLLRGFSDPESSQGQTIVDLVFVYVTRICINSSYGSVVIRLRESRDDVSEALIGRQFPDDKVYLINPGEGYGFVVAERFDWAVLRIAGHEPSPLLSEDRAALLERVEGDIYYM